MISCLAQCEDRLVGFPLVFLLQGNVLIDAENWEDCSEHSFSLLMAWKLDKLPNVWSPLVFVRLTTHKCHRSCCLLKRGNFILQFTFSTHMITFPAMRLLCLITWYHICFIFSCLTVLSYMNFFENIPPGERERGRLGTARFVLQVLSRLFWSTFCVMYLTAKRNCVLMLAFLYLVFFCCVCEQWKGLLSLSKLSLGTRITNLNK